MTELDLRTDPAPLLRQAAAELTRRGKTHQLVVLEANFARAYVYAGEWVADCPGGCNNVEFLTDKPAHARGRAGYPGERKTVFHCSYCHYVTDSIHWPVDAEDIMAVLDRRPIPHTRNWYPQGHLTAVKFGLPDGQTVADLEDENREHGVI